MARVAKVGIAAIPLFASCSRTSEPIWIGAVAMLTDADEGEDSLRGVRIAMDEANRAGGIDGRRVELRIMRDSGRGELAVRVAREFVADKRIVGVLGHEFSSAMIAATPVYEGNLAAVGTATSPQLTGISPWVFRVAQSDSVLATDEARLFAAKGWHRVAILYVNDAFGRGLSATFTPAFRARGGEVVRRDPVSDTTSDFDVYLRAYAQSKPDAVLVLCGPRSVVAFLHAAAAHHLKAQVVGGNGWAASMANDPAANGAVWSSVFLPSDTQGVASRFRRDFTTRYGHVPDAIAAEAYDGALAMLEAIRRGGPDRAGVRQALAAPTVLAMGTTGPISFARGDRVGSVGGLVRVEHGQLKTDMRWSDLKSP